MSRLNPEKLHVRYLPGTQPKTLVIPRRYTLTHSDRTGDLYLTIGLDFDYRQISGFYTRFMRDEVLAEWIKQQESLSIHVYCHVSGGFVFGRASWRESIFRSEMHLVLEAIRYADQDLFEKHALLDCAPIFVHFKRSKANKDKVEQWGMPSDYRIEK